MAKDFERKSTELAKKTGIYSVSHYNRQFWLSGEQAFDQNNELMRVTLDKASLVL
ncbi:hypothetical protein [Pseudochrobactrum kiredjianiae]|uniref:Transposase n=1 Tax=Pseudochrobactrum kiredjianiae TaxID=386305 RepID=A0ABW3UZU9_9HYPH|nr:hypothetical protein [Pseudochrobactrum kiredjianiae]MDM7852463.1 hypothetical protein [Pseudochrobactrum kiredjianiae]